MAGLTTIPDGATQHSIGVEISSTGIKGTIVCSVGGSKLTKRTSYTTNIWLLLSQWCVVGVQAA